MLNSSSAVPLYRQVMDKLREQIDSGAYQPGDRIPSEAELAMLYGVSRITVRRAVEELAGVSMLTKRQGKGTYVNPPKLRHRIVQNRDALSFEDACAQAGRTGCFVTDVVEREEPDDEIRSFLGLAAGTAVLRLRQRGLADGVAVMLVDAYLDLNEFAFLEDMDLSADDPLFPLIRERSGRRPVNQGCCLLDIVRATPECAKRLDVAVGEPLYRIDAHLCDGEGRPLMVSRALIVGSLYTFNLV